MSDVTDTALQRESELDPIGFDRAIFGDKLRCPRCDYNLRGLTSDRCPECGLTIDWAAIVEAARRRNEGPTFEFQWRRRPIRSFCSTLFLSIQPWTIWKQIPLTSSPRPGALLLLISLTLPFYYIVELTIYALMDIAAGIQNSSYFQFLEVFRYRRQFTYFIEFKSPSYVVLAGLGLFTYGALVLFQRSLLGYRVRRIHLLRIATLVFCCIFTAVMLNKFIFAVCTVVVRRFPTRLALEYTLQIPVNAVTLLLPVWSISRAARDYLQVARPWQFGGTILALGLLFAMTFFTAYSVAVDDLANSLGYAGGDLWPGLGLVTNWLWEQLAQ